MPSPDESTPNFDFLNNDSVDETPAWSPPSTDSALDLLDAPQDVDDSDDDDDVAPVPPPSKPVAPKAERPKPTKPKTSPPPQLASDDETDQQPAKPRAATAGKKSSSRPKKQRVAKTAPSGEASESVDVPTKRSAARRKKKSSRPSSPTSSSSDDAGFTISGTMAIALVSYAITMTIITLYYMLMSETHQLESLPDRAPLKADEFRFVPESASVAPGHRLKVGDATQFGHILVEPIKVTRGLAELKHYSNTDGLTPPAEPQEVFKLWFRLTNESSDQMIAPFDRRLVYDRRVDDNFDVRSDQYVVPANEQGTDAPNLVMYDLSPDGEWDVVGQELPVLKPGESVTTFLAAGPDEMDRLVGPAVWRVLMRKGFHDATGHGVLTLIDVEFDASQATSDS